MPPQLLPMAWLYSHMIKGFSGCSARNFLMSATGVYIWLSISEVAGYSRFQKMPS